MYIRVPFGLGQNLQQMKSEMSMTTSVTMMMCMMILLFLYRHAGVVHLAWLACGLMEGNFGVDPNKKIIICTQHFVLPFFCTNYCRTNSIKFKNQFLYLIIIRKHRFCILSIELELV